MEQELKQIECDGQCGFMARSRDEKELIEIAKKHVKEIHKMAVSDADMKSRITVVQQTVGAKS